MPFSDLTVLHEHQQMNMRTDFVHKKCGFTGRFHPFWPMHSLPERTRVWTHCAGRHAPGSVTDASDGRAAPSIGAIELFAFLVLKPSTSGAGDHHEIHSIS